MRIGVAAGLPTPGGTDVVENQVEGVVAAEEYGFDGVWFNHALGPDSLIGVALAGQRTKRIEMITGVIPVYSRQPLLMAQQALSAQLAAKGRLTLGIGLAHPETVPRTWGSEYTRPLRFMKEYLSALLPLLEDRAVSFFGEMLSVEAALNFSEVTPPRVMLAALGPKMLELAGSKTDGTFLWVTGPRAIESHIAPKIREAAAKAGRSAPRICAALPMCITDDVEAGRRAAAKLFARYGKLVNYRRVLDMEGVETPGDVAIVGTEEQAAEQLQALDRAGTTDFFGSPFGLAADDGESIPRTWNFLRSMVAKL
jgi:F420-dependent oxidoreductase-like protein